MGIFQGTITSPTLRKRENQRFKKKTLGVGICRFQIPQPPPSSSQRSAVATMWLVSTWWCRLAALMLRKWWAARPRVTFRGFYHIISLPNLNISYHQEIPRNCITLSSAFKPCKQGGFRIRFKQNMTPKILLEQPKDSASNHCFKKVSFSVHCFRFLSIRRDGFPTTKKPTSSAKITGSSESDVDGSKSTSSRQRFTIQSDVNHDVAVNSPINSTRWTKHKITGLLVLPLKNAQLRAWTWPRKRASAGPSFGSP